MNSGAWRATVRGGSKELDAPERAHTYTYKYLCLLNPEPRGREADTKPALHGPMQHVWVWTSTPSSAEAEDWTTSSTWETKEGCTEEVALMGVEGWIRVSQRGKVVACYYEQRRQVMYGYSYKNPRGVRWGGWACVIDEGSSDAQGELQHLWISAKCFQFIFHLNLKNSPKPMKSGLRKSQALGWVLCIYHLFFIYYY